MAGRPTWACKARNRRGAMQVSSGRNRRREDHGTLIRHQRPTGSTILQQCALWDVGCSYAPTTEVLNSATRVVLKMKFQHIRPTLLQPSAISSTGWLPVKQRVEFKQALFVYKVLRQTAPTVPCRHVSIRVNEFHATPSSLARSRGSCMVKLWRLELRCRTTTTRYTESEVFPRLLHSFGTHYTDDRSQRFYLMNSFSGRLKAELFRRAYGTD